MNETNQIKKNTNKLTSLPIIIILAILGIALLLWSGESDSNNRTNTDNERLEAYRNTIEEKISSLCSSVNGVSAVRVSVYFTTGFETVYAYNEQVKDTSSGTNTEKKYVTIGSGTNESMVCIVEKMPTIGGIAIVCRGGGDSKIAKELISLISSAYGISTNKIYVTEGKK